MEVKSILIIWRRSSMVMDSKLLSISKIIKIQNLLQHGASVMRIYSIRQMKHLQRYKKKENRSSALYLAQAIMIHLSSQMAKLSFMNNLNKREITAQSMLTMRLGISLN